MTITRSTAGNATYTVLAGYTSLTAKLWGAGYEGQGGGAITGTISVVVGDVIHTEVGSGALSENGGGGTALKVVRGGTIIGKLLAGGGGGSGAKNNGGGGGGLDGATGSDTGNRGTGATRLAAGIGAAGNNGSGPYNFTTFGAVNNGGLRDAEDSGASGGPGGGGYFGGGGGQTEYNDPYDDSGGGGGGSGFDEGFSSVATYTGASNGGGTAGNAGDPDRPANAGSGLSTYPGAAVLKLS